VAHMTYSVPVVAVAVADVAVVVVSTSTLGNTVLGGGLVPVPVTFESLRNETLSHLMCPMNLAFPVSVRHV